MRRYFALLALAVLSASAVAVAQDKQEFPRFEVFGGYSMHRTGLDLSNAAGEPSPTKFLKSGLAASFDYNMTPLFGIETDIWYSHGTILRQSEYVAPQFYHSTQPASLLVRAGSTPGSFGRRIATASGEVYPAAAGALKDVAFLSGPRFTLRKGKLSPFAHALFGLDHAEFSTSGGELDTAGPVLAELAGSETGDGTDNGFGLALGGGMDLNLCRVVAIRAIQADYYLSHHSSNNISNLELSFGLVFKIGRR
jgi:opacity protein-like surface antigen